MSSWTRHGDCNHCGHCCTMVAREALVRTADQVDRDYEFYVARGFRPMWVDGEERHVLFAWLHAPCPHMQVRHEYVGNGTFAERSRCGIHDERPRTCQEFPRLPVDIVGTPCSYWFEREVGSEENTTTQRMGGSGSPHPATEADLLRLEG